MENEAKDNPQPGAHLEDLMQGTVIRGIMPGGAVTVVDVKWHGTNAVELFYKDTTGRAGNRLLFRDDEQSLERGQLV